MGTQMCDFGEEISSYHLNYNEPKYGYRAWCLFNNRLESMYAMYVWESGINPLATDDGIFEKKKNVKNLFKFNNYHSNLFNLSDCLLASFADISLL